MIKTLEEYKQAGEEIYNGLSGMGIVGVDQRGHAAIFHLKGESVTVEPFQKPPYGTSMGIDSFVSDLATAIAIEKGETVSDYLDQEAKVVSYAILNLVRRNKARRDLDIAVSKYVDSPLPQKGQLPSYIEPSLQAVASEARARNFEPYFESSYKFLASLAGTPEIAGVAE